MNLADYYAISDLILQKLNQTQDDARSGNIERHLLLPYTTQLSKIQNIGLIQAYADGIFEKILIVTTLRTINELTKVNPDTSKILKMLEPIEEFIKTKIGYSDKDISEAILNSDQKIKEDLDTLIEEMRQWVKDMPQVAMASEVPDDIKDGLNELKEQFMKMKKENIKWNK